MWLNRALTRTHSQQNNSLGSVGVYNNILKIGKQNKKCMACNRPLDHAELKALEKHVRSKREICRNGLILVDLDQRCHTKDDDQRPKGRGGRNQRMAWTTSIFNRPQTRRSGSL